MTGTRVMIKNATKLLKEKASKEVSSLRLKSKSQVMKENHQENRQEKTVTHPKTGAETQTTTNIDQRK